MLLGFKLADDGKTWLNQCFRCHGYKPSMEMVMRGLVEYCKECDEAMIKEDAAMLEAYKTFRASLATIDATCKWCGGNYRYPLNVPEDIYVK